MSINEQVVGRIGGAEKRLEALESQEVASGSSIAILTHEQTSNTHGGGLASGAWRQVTLNTVRSDVDGIVALSSNRFTPVAGNYLIMWSAPGYLVDRYKSRLQNIGQATTVAEGGTELDIQSGGIQIATRSLGSAYFTADGVDDYEIQQRVSLTNSASGQGFAAAFGTEVYLTVTLIQLSGNSGAQGATQLSELSDVNTSTPTAGNILEADGVDWESIPNPAALKALSNLAGTAVNTDIISDTDDTDDLGSSAIRWSQIWGKHLFGNAHAFIVKNTSGATASANDVGYIDEAGEYKTTTTAQDNVPWCVVLVGAANNSDIYVTRRGRVTVAYTGTAPAAGDFLSTSTTAGSGQQETAMRPEIFAVCLAAGSGGDVEVLLLTQRTFLPVTSTEDIFRINDHSGTLFSGTISSKSGADIVYTISTGNEDSIDPRFSTQLGKFVLHNTTRGDSALIDDVDTGTNTITLTATAPAAWAATDVITVNSQTNTTTLAGGEAFQDVDLTDADNDAIPVNAVAAYIYMKFREDVVGEIMILHPFETNDNQKRVSINSLDAAQSTNNLVLFLPLIDRKFCHASTASGAGTARSIVSLLGVMLATP